MTIHNLEKDEGGSIRESWEQTNGGSDK